MKIIISVIMYLKYKLQICVIKNNKCVSLDYYYYNLLIYKDEV